MAELHPTSARWGPQLDAVFRPIPPLSRFVGIAGGGYLLAFAAASLLTNQRSAVLGDVAPLVPPLAYAVLAFVLARRCTGQVRTFWNLNAIHGVIWAIGQMVWIYLDVFAGQVPVISPTDPIFFASSIPLAAALYGRPERDQPRWLFDIVLLDIILIVLFAAFVYIYFVVTLAVTDGRREAYHANFTQLLNVKNLLLAGWAAWVWQTATSPVWRRVLGIYCGGLTLAFLGGVVTRIADGQGVYAPGSLWDLAGMAPYLLMALAAARAHDAQLFAPAEEAPALARLPVVSLIAVALLILIPTTDELARRVLDVAPSTEAVRTQLALTMMIPFGVVVFVREFLSRRALLRAGQQVVAAREQLAQKEKLAAVGQLVSGVAHELNNPLQGVLGYAELLAQADVSGANAEELKAIRENANRAASIVRNLLTFAGRETPARNWQQVNRIVSTAASKQSPALVAANVRVKLDLADRLPLVYLDSVRFEQVVINLLKNAEAAIEARRSGVTQGVSVPRQVPGEIIAQTRRESAPDRIVIDIADNGSGVRTEDLSKVFDPFFTTRRVGEGTGLGLSVCYGIVREHGGLIHAHNRETGGAVFTIELPVTADSYGHEEGEPGVASRPAAMSGRKSDPAVTALVPAATATPPVRKARALVVDDEDSNAALVRRALSQAGYEVESTTLSRRALVMIERTPYDVVIADVKMPEMNGPDLYARACQIRPEMARRFIFITGDIDGEDTLDFLEQSRCGYFLKPFNLERLTSAVETLVGDSRG